MRNSFADFGVSVYGELVAVWIAERDDGAYWDADWRTARSPRAQHWLGQIAGRFDRLSATTTGWGAFRTERQITKSEVIEPVGDLTG